MKKVKFVKKFFTAIVALTLAFGCVVANADTLKLKANKNEVLRTAGLEMFGVGGEWGLGVSGITPVEFPHTAINQKLVDELKMQGLSFGFYRQAGASSTAFRWKNTIGPIASRVGSIGASSLYSIGVSSFGVNEYIKYAQAFEGENAMINYTVSMVEDNPQDMADLAEYLYGDGTINYNGGVNWAKVRIANGIKDPVNVFAWELGNEYDASQTVHLFINSDIYVEQCKKFIHAIRSVNPDAKIAIAAPMVSSFIESRDNYWLYNGLLELEPYIDYVVVHGYVTMDAAYKRDNVMLTVIDELKRISGGRIKILNTEYNAQGTLNEREGTDATAWGYGMPLYYSGARTVLDALCRTLSNPEIACANYYSAADGTSYSCFYLDSDNKYKLNVTGMMLAMAQTYGMGDVLRSELDGFELNKPAECSGIVVKDKDENLNVILVNNTNDKDFYINFDFGGKYELIEKQTISANAPNALDYIDIKEIDRTTEKYNNPQITSGYDLRHLCVAALKLREVAE